MIVVRLTNEQTERVLTKIEDEDIVNAINKAIKRHEIKNKRRKEKKK